METSAEVEKAAVEASVVATDAEAAQDETREAGTLARQANGLSEEYRPGPEGQSNGVDNGQVVPSEEAKPPEVESEAGEAKNTESDATKDQGEPLGSRALTTPEGPAPGAEATADFAAPTGTTTAAAKVVENGSEPSLAEAQEHQHLPVTERRKVKRLEIFVGGLPAEATEEDVKRIFGRAGQIAEVRLSRDSATGKSRGYCFVRYTTEAAAGRALNELERAQVHGITVGVLPGEEQDTLFLGNICQTWTKTMIEEALNVLGIEEVQNVIFVEDPNEASQNRGFCFVELFSRAAAAKALARLQQPDALLGKDTPVRVTWAEPLSEPDAQAMAQVRSVFVDGMRAEWDEAQAGSFFSKFGEVKSVVLARSIPSAKRGDYGFISFTARAAALAAIEALHEKEVVEGEVKMKLTVALAKPRGKRNGAGGATSEREEWGVPSDEDMTKGEVTALLETLKEQALLYEAGKGAAAGDLAGQGDTEAAGQAKGGNTGANEDGTAQGAGTGEEAGVGVQDTASALTEALAREMEKRLADGKLDNTGAEGAKGAANGAPKGPGKGKEESEEGKDGSKGGKEGGKEGGAGGGEKREREKPPADKFECGMCGFGSDVEEDYMRHQMSRVHRIIADLRQDEKLNNKTPLSLLNEFAMRSKIEVKYEMKGEGAGPFEVHASLGGGPNCVPDVVGVGAGRQKTRAKQMSAADALDKLMVHIPEADFTRPGNKTRTRRLGPGAAGAQAGGFSGRGPGGGPYGPPGLGPGPGPPGFGRGWWGDGGMGRGGRGQRDVGQRGFDQRMGGYMPGYGRSGPGLPPGGHPFQPPGMQNSILAGRGGDLADMIRRPPGYGGGYSGGVPGERGVGVGMGRGGESYAERFERVQGRHAERPGYMGAPQAAAYAGMKRPLQGEAGGYGSGTPQYPTQRPRVDPYAAPSSQGYAYGTSPYQGSQYPPAPASGATAPGGTAYGTPGAYSGAAGAGAGAGAGGATGGATGYSSAAAGGTSAYGGAASAGSYGGVYPGQQGQQQGQQAGALTPAVGAYGASQNTAGAAQGYEGYNSSTTSYGQYQQAQTQQKQQQYGGSYAQYGSSYQQPAAGATAPQHQAYQQTAATTQPHSGTQYQAATSTAGGASAATGGTPEGYGAAYGAGYDYYNTSYTQQTGGASAAAGGATGYQQAGYGYTHGAQGGYTQGAQGGYTQGAQGGYAQGSYPAGGAAAAGGVGGAGAGAGGAAATGAGTPSAVAGGATGSGVGGTHAAAGSVAQQGYGQYGAAHNGATGGGYY